MNVHTKSFSTWKWRSKACALVALCITLSWLTACKAVRPISRPISPASPDTVPTLYQPPLLRPLKGQPIQTHDGIYRPQSDAEVWHSDARYRSLETLLFKPVR